MSQASLRAPWTISYSPSHAYAWGEVLLTRRNEPETLGWSKPLGPRLRPPPGQFGGVNGGSIYLCEFCSFFLRPLGNEQGVPSSSSSAVASSLTTSQIANNRNAILVSHRQVGCNA